MSGDIVPIEYLYPLSTTQHQTTNETTTTTGAGAMLAAARGYSQAAFEELAQESPQDLAQIIRENQARDTRLTFAAEILGREVRTAMAANLLKGILHDHPSPLVREGAVLGLAYHIDRIGIRGALARAATEDPSPGVRRAASEALETD
jgi:hypothetical protein